jgi:hypothetical protein
MFAAKLKGKITQDRRLVVQVPRDVEPGTVEVILLQSPNEKSAKRRARQSAAHPAFGLWAKRADIVDSASFAEHVRRRVETRADGNDRD